MAPVQHRGRAETEAESVAHIVCAAFGLDSEPYTDAYVMGWADGDIDIVRAAAATSCGWRVTSSTSSPRSRAVRRHTRPATRGPHPAPVVAA
ncbi:hypothetical protein [Pseudonocardia autotrophica]|uniref:hypothetical protein n=1 Tax=Pseudonocardia autotrophica TaxID=2074 RepID=UPI00105C200A|nr:hypothetical protein [Pseudonocardia autotrophica]